MRARRIKWQVIRTMESDFNQMHHMAALFLRIPLLEWCQRGMKGIPATTNNLYRRSKHDRKLYRPQALPLQASVQSKALGQTRLRFDRMSNPGPRNREIREIRQLWQWFSIIVRPASINTQLDWKHHVPQLLLSIPEAQCVQSWTLAVLMWAACCFPFHGFNQELGLKTVVL